MNIMVVRNTAGSLTPVADWLSSKGHNVVIFEVLDPFGLSSYSDNTIIQHRRRLYETIIKHIFEMNPDVIHINTAHSYIPFVRLFTQRIPIVFMYHGSEIRTRSKNGLSQRREVSWANKVLVSTPDLKEFGEWYDRPVPSFFRYEGGRVKGSALMIYAEFFAEYGKDQRVLAREVCAKLGLDLTIREGRNKNPIQHIEMPKLYSRYEYFLDFKGHDTDKTFALSKSAHEAMRCGCKVLQDRDPYLPLRPEEYLKGEALFQQYSDLYMSLKKDSYLKVIPRFIKAAGRILMSQKPDTYITVYRYPTTHGIIKLGYYAYCFFRYVVKSMFKGAKK